MTTVILLSIGLLLLATGFTYLMWLVTDGLSAQAKAEADTLYRAVTRDGLYTIQSRPWWRPWWAYTDKCYWDAPVWYRPDLAMRLLTRYRVEARGRAQQKPSSRVEVVDDYDLRIAVYQAQMLAADALHKAVEARNTETRKAREAEQQAIADAEPQVNRILADYQRAVGGPDER